VNSQSRTITFTVNRKTGEAFDAILNIPQKMMPDATKRDNGWWTFTGPWGPAKLKFNENKQLGILDYQVVENDAKWNVPMRVISKGNDSELITTIIKPDTLSDETFNERMKEIEKIILSMKQIIEET
jgi:2-keto-4-pentenoate hydratase